MYTRKNKIINIIFVLCLSLLLYGCNSSNNCLYQLPSQTYSQMMSYIIEYKDKTIVIDGGTVDDEAYLIEKIKQISKNNTIDAWFITHYHKDHTGALSAYLNKNNEKVNIKKIYYNFPEEKWVKINDNNRLVDFQTINKVLNKENSKIVEIGDRINIGNILVEVLRVYNPLITNNAGNNSSCVYKFSINNSTILFLGDLGIEGGKELLKNNSEDIKNMDYVQMSHHGQAGVSEEVYQVINPKYCLWPTTEWLWENKDGIYRTDETKKWMKKLNIKKHYVAKDGLISINLD